MPGAWSLSVVAVCYIGLLFAIAHFGERRATLFRSGWWAPLIYSLSLAVYCTAWTIYGSVGHAAWSGIGFALTYIGPVLMLVLGYPLLQKLIRTAKANNATSIADFIGARYGKSQSVAVLVTVIAVIGVVPFIALQLQAVSTTFEVLAFGPRPGPRPPPSPWWQDTAFYVALLMASFAVLFGLRRVRANEQNPGMMTAIAFESLVKLGAFLVLGLFAVYAIFGGGELAARAAETPRILERVVRIDIHEHWLSITLVAGLAFICLPRQFHVAVVENSNPDHLRTAAWVFPLYLLALAVLVPVVAAAGMFTFPRALGFPAEIFPLLWPMNSGRTTLSIAVFIAGLSAATAMIILEVVALSTMICNEIVMPLRSRRAALSEGAKDNMPQFLLGTRWIAALGVLLAAYAYHASTASRYSLASIGLISFVAVAQFAPALIAGLYWRRAHRFGAIAGIVGGSAVWAHAMLVPASSALPAGGADAIARLPPIQGIDPFTGIVFWSLLTNTVLLLVVSLFARSSERDRLQAEAFVAGGGEPTRPDRAGRPIHASTYHELRRLAERLLGTEQASHAFAGLSERGSEKELAAHTERLLSGTIGAASAHIMVTAVLQHGRTSILTEASEAILFNHELLRATLENVTQGIGMFDARGQLAAWNRRFLEMLSIPPEHAVIGTPLALVCGDTPLPTSMQAGQHRLQDGRVLELQVNPIQAGGFVLVCTDVSAQIETVEALQNSERQIREANEMLEARVSERTRELTLLNEQLASAKRAAEAANVGKTRFFAAASHDLLQPLHVARILTGALSERFGASKSSTLNQLDAALGSVDDLLQTLLDISKLDTGAVQPQLQPVDLNELLRGIGASFQPVAAQRGLRLRVVPSRAIALTDPALLRRILQNFLSNALRYTRPGGKVLIGCRRRAGRIALEVWDTGVGIPDSQRLVIFEEFRRGNNDPDTPPGLGLGLAIVDRIARMLQHPVSVRSWPGRGSVFCVSVPRSTETPFAKLPSTRDRPRGSLADRVILCVDNDPAVLAAMRTLLQGWSCDVLIATNVGEAQEEIRKHGAWPDMVLMDYHLGSELTGLAALDELSAEAGRHLPAILITANYTDAVRKDADAREYPVLHKPVRPGALRALMAQMLTREARRAVR
jgi:Na+/proline symporter/signal transduction histidine kinase